MSKFKMVSLKKAEVEDIEDDVASEDANEDSEEENDSDAGESVAKESEESRKEKLTRTIFIGNLPANFPLKVFYRCNYLLYLSNRTFCRNWRKI